MLKDLPNEDKILESDEVKKVESSDNPWELENLLQSVGYDAEREKPPQQIVPDDINALGNRPEQENEPLSIGDRPIVKLAVVVIILASTLGFGIFALLTMGSASTRQTAKAVVEQEKQEKDDRDEQINDLQQELLLRKQAERLAALDLKKPETPQPQETPTPEPTPTDPPTTSLAIDSTPPPPTPIEVLPEPEPRPIPKSKEEPKAVVRMQPPPEIRAQNVSRVVSPPPPATTNKISERKVAPPPPAVVTYRVKQSSKNDDRGDDTEQEVRFLNSERYLLEGRTPESGKVVVLGTSVEASLDRSLQTLGDTTSVLIVKLEEPLEDRYGQVVLPEETLLRFKVAVADNGFLAVEPLDANINGETIYLPVNSLTLEAEDEDDPLVAEMQQLGDLSDNDLLTFVYGALSKTGEVLTAPDVQTSTSSGLGSFSTTTSSTQDPDVLGAVLNGGFEPLTRALEQRNKAEIERVLNNTPFWYLPRGFELRVIANDNFEI
jgi:outer membrane biosynthesis protein TonB